MLKFLSLLFLILTSASYAFEALPKTAPTPKNNPSFDGKIELGKKLYFDTRLSSTNTVSCNSCHNVMGSGTDNLPVSFGVGKLKGGRNSPTVWNAAFHFAQFWDGRAATLEDQAKGPIVNPVEMAMKDSAEVVQKIAAIGGYVELFKQVYGDKPIDIDMIAQAIAAYERTLITPDSPYDKYVGGDAKAISPAAIRGLQLVKTVGCATCHNGPLFAGPMYMKFPMIPDATYEKKYGFSKDLGRYEVTKQEQDKNFWRIPTWRNIDITGPYFHNGSVKTLDEAVRVMAKTQLGRVLKDNEVQDIVAFLKTLTGVRPKQTPPSLPN